MAKDKITSPASFKGVMVSSTFTELEKHRDELMKALQKEELFPIGMENYVAVPDDDVISSSLGMVRKGSAYIGLISRRCGQVPECATRNPHSYSITRLEFEEAQKLGLPTLIFIMGDGHLLTERDVETDPVKIEKLKAFRERAKEKDRVYVPFASLDDFTQQAIHVVAGLRRYFDEPAEPAPTHPQDTAPNTPVSNPDLLPTPPAFYAEPPYIGSHEFVGRKAQFETLNDWAAPADSHPVLLFEAIGGTGKSMLTWEWATEHATRARGDWAGRFWYSFYERGAVMADFCQRALAYITGQALEDFRKKKTLELSELLLHHLKAKPWLIVFDGLERVLVAYHRYDAAQLSDEEAGVTADQIANRDPCAAIRPEDDELLRTLAGAAPSKLLLTSRLIPSVLLNSASQPIPGVLRERLPGLRPSEAEELLRSCKITGTSQEMQNYLQSHCDCHPLVIGVLAGLINDYLPDRGNFDAWASDPSAGGKLDLANLDLIQKRNHILNAAFEALDRKSGELLSLLALLSEAIDYPTLTALNPHLPPELQKVEIPDRPESPEFQAASRKLSETVRDLERRGLLQYDPQTKRHDLHPVVRSVAAGRLGREETERYGQRVVDHFSQKAHSPYEEAETLEDVRDGLHIVRTLLQMGRHRQACAAYSADLAIALLVNLEARAEVLSLLQPFFPHGWATRPNGLDRQSRTLLMNNVGNALFASGEWEEALGVYGAALLEALSERALRHVSIILRNIGQVLMDKKRLAAQKRLVNFALDLAEMDNDTASLFATRRQCFRQLARIGEWADAEAMWQLLSPMGRDWPRNLYRSGDAEHDYARFCLSRGVLSEMHLAHAEELARAGKNRPVVQSMHVLRGEWQLEQGQWPLAFESLYEAVRMAREVGRPDPKSETQLALARFHLGQLSNPTHEVEQLAQAREPFHRGLANLWHVIGDRERAKEQALLAYKWAWADGEPYVSRYELNQARALLEQLGVEIPDLPPYDPDKDEKFPWEDQVSAFIEKLRAEKEAENSAEENTEE